MTNEQLLEGLRLMADLLASGWNHGAVAGEASARLRNQFLFTALIDAAPVSYLSMTDDQRRDDRLRRVLAVIATLEQDIR